jgi:hypothetical protein
MFLLPNPFGNWKLMMYSTYSNIQNISMLVRSQSCEYNVTLNTMHIYTCANKNIFKVIHTYFTTKQNTSLILINHIGTHHSFPPDVSSTPSQKCKNFNRQNKHLICHRESSLSAHEFNCYTCKINI